MLQAGHNGNTSRAQPASTKLNTKHAGNVYPDKNTHTGPENPDLPAQSAARVATRERNTTTPNAEHKGNNSHVRSTNLRQDVKHDGNGPANRRSTTEEDINSPMSDTAIPRERKNANIFRDTSHAQRPPGNSLPGPTMNTTLTEEEQKTLKKQGIHNFKPNPGKEGEFTTAIWNVNGIGALVKKGALRRFLTRHNPDVIALSEIKISLKKLNRNRAIHLLLRAFGYLHCYWHPMTTGHGGLHGTALFCKTEPKQVIRGWAHDPEGSDGDGRVITAVFKTHVMIHTYTPCSTWPEKKMTEKWTRAKAKAKDRRRRTFDARLQRHTAYMKGKTRKPVILCGDMNVTAKKEDHDLRKPCIWTYPGHKPWEREDFHNRNRQLELVDVYRHFVPKATAEDHTQWQNESAYIRGHGQRIDYVLASNELLRESLTAPLTGQTAPHITRISLDQRMQGSDHCPLFFTMNTGSTLQSGECSPTEIPPTQDEHNGTTVTETPTSPDVAGTDSMNPGDKRDTKREHTTMSATPLTRSEFEALPSMAMHTEPDTGDIATYSHDEYPECLSNPHDHAFDTFADSTAPLFTSIDNSDVTSTKAATVASLMQCKAMTASVPTSWTQAGQGEEAKLKTLWDTGASYTILSYDAYRRLRDTASRYRLSRPGGVTPSFMLANGDIVKPMGKLQLHLRFGAEEIKHRAWVMRGGQFDLILGVDFFSKWDATFHFTEGNEHIKIHGLPRKPTIPFRVNRVNTFRGAASPVVTKETLLLKPRCRYRTNLRLMTGDGLVHMNSVGIIEGTNEGNSHCHLVTTTISKMEDGQMVAEVVNFTDKPVTLREGTLVGSYTAIREDCIGPEERPTGQEAKRQDTVPLTAVNLDELITKEDCPLNAEGLPVHLEPKLEAAKAHLTDMQFKRLKALLIRFADVFAKDYSKPPVADMEPMRINIPDDATPVSAPRRRFSPKERALIQKYALKLLKSGIVEESDSNWRSNVLLVPKPDGSWRVCLDFRAINNLTVTTSSNLPSLADNLDLLGGKEIYSAFDILSAYWSCDLYEPHRKYTGFFVPGIGNLQFKRAAMGLSNAGTHFVKLTLKMLEGTLFEYVAAYADDVFVYSDSIDEHIDVHLPEVLQRFRNYNVSLKGCKAEICVKQLDWCGYRISTKGIEADPRKITAIMDMPRPRTLKQLRSFLGSCNFLRRWIPHFADITEPLRVLLKKGHFKKKWTDKQVQAWETLRDALGNCPVLAHPRFDRPFFIHCDASTVAIGAALMQKSDDGTTQVVAYLSKSLNKTQRNYAIHEVEALSVLYALETWHSYLFGQKKVDVHCDSQAVCWLFKANSKYEGRCMRWALRAGRWPVQLHHIKGVKNHLADTLSRCPAESKSQTPKHEPEILCSSCTPDDHPDLDRLQEEHNRAHHLSALTRSQTRNNRMQSDRRAVKEREGDSGRPTTTEEKVAENTRRHPNSNAWDDDWLDRDHTRGTAIDDKEGTNIDHNPWENIFPNDEFKDDILELRPTLTLWHRVPDKIGMFREHQQNDAKVKDILARLQSQECTNRCHGCAHDDGCLRKWWCLADGDVLTRCSMSKPLPRRKRAVGIFAKLQKPCECGGDSKECPHYLYALSPRDQKAPSAPSSTALEPTIAATVAQAGVNAGPAAFEQFDVHRIHRKLVVPKTLVTSVLYHIHGSGVAGHPGATRSHSRASRLFWWKGMRSDIRRWVGSCLRCQQRKPPRAQNVNRPGKTDIPKGPMQEIYIDFSGPFPPTKRGNMWILTVVCAYARYPIAVALPRRTATLVVRTLLEHVIQHYACPVLMVSDGAREFVGQTVADFCTIFGIEHRINPAYSPSLASYVERYHAWQNASLTILTSRYKDNWDLMLPLVTLSYSTTVQASTGFTPFETIRGYEPRMPFEAWNAWPGSPDPGSDEMSMIQTQMRDLYLSVREAHDRATEAGVERRSGKHRPTSFKPGDTVLRYAPKTAEVLPHDVPQKPKLMDRWSLPNIVVAKGDKGIYIVRDENGKLHDVRPDLLRRFTFFKDGLPSIPARKKFTKSERTRMNKARKVSEPPRTANPGDLVCFPMAMRQGPGFGVGKVLAVDHTGSYDLQFFSNDSEALEGAFRPCWLNAQGHWYCGKRRDNDRPMDTRTFYTGTLRQESFAAVGFDLLATGKVPRKVLEAMDKHPSFDWRLPEQE